MHLDKRFTGQLNWVPDGPLRHAVFDLRSLKAYRQHGIEEEEGGMHAEAEEHASDFSVHKRPGRMTTQFPVITDERELDQADDDSAAYGADAEMQRGHDRQLLGSGLEAPKGLPGIHTPQQTTRQTSKKSWGSTKGAAKGSATQSLRGAADAVPAQPSSGHVRAGAMKPSSTRTVDAVDDELSGVAGALHRGPVRTAGGEEGVYTGRGGRPLNLTTDNARRRLLVRSTITSMLDAEKIWKQGFSGKGVKVGVFDTGIAENHPHIRNIRERSNWTHQNSLSDGLGHGSFVAGVIGSQDGSCPGFAPDVELHTFKVFTDDQVSFTSWFLDAFNYALISGVQIINLSIGGPDFLDQPFVDKVLEITSNGIIMISAIGNDGPLYGTLNNPADQMDVIGVGGIDDHNNIASFSSRGMTTWELTVGSGRVKPDVMAYSKDVTGSKIGGGCRTLSGTSVASPVVAGAVCLLASTVPEAVRWSVLNPASMKQALVEGADRLPSLNIYEQGAGRINLAASMAVLKGYQPRASIIPAKIDLQDCPYMWPYCRQAMYAGAMPVIINATILNAMGVAGNLEGPPVFTASDVGGKLLHIQFEWSETLWPWSGYLALYLRVRPHGATFTGTASGNVEFTVVSPPAPGETQPRKSTVVLPVRVRIQPPPPRQKRILWDQFHSIKYPPGYMPRDNLDIKHDILDWHGDHLYTNYHGLFNFLRDKDYYVEVLSSPLTCFDATQYAALLIVDSEDEFYSQEVSKLAADVKEQGLNVVVIAEWYHVESMLSMKFFDDNTRSWWTPATGGANVPALNDLLAPYGVALGDAVLAGSFSIAGMKVQMNHGADVARMPPNSFLHKATINSMAGKTVAGTHGVLGVAPVGSKGGHVAVYGDSNCLDSSHQHSPCYEFLARILERVIQGKDNGIAGKDAEVGSGGYTRANTRVPERRTDITFSDYSWVLRHDLKCYPSGMCQYQPATPHTPTATTCGDFTAAGKETPTSTRNPQPSTSVSITYPARSLSVSESSATRGSAVAANAKAAAAAAGAGTAASQGQQASSTQNTQQAATTTQGSVASAGSSVGAKAGSTTQGSSTQGIAGGGSAAPSAPTVFKLVNGVSPFRLGLSMGHVVGAVCAVAVLTMVVIWQTRWRSRRRDLSSGNMRRAGSVGL